MWMKPFKNRRNPIKTSRSRSDCDCCIANTFQELFWNWSVVTQRCKIHVQDSIVNATTRQLRLITTSFGKSSQGTMTACAFYLSQITIEDQMINLSGRVYTCDWYGIGLTPYLSSIYIYIEISSTKVSIPWPSTPTHHPTLTRKLPGKGRPPWSGRFQHAAAVLVGPTAPRPSPVLLLLLPSSAGLRSVATGSFVGAAFVCWVAFFWVVDAQIVYLKDSKGKKKNTWAMATKCLSWHSYFK